MHLGLSELEVHIVFLSSPLCISVLFVLSGSLGGFAWFILSEELAKGSNTRASTAVLDRLNWGFLIYDAVI